MKISEVKKTGTAIFILSLTIAFAGCKKDKETEFDRKSMLTNMADNVIIPAYISLNTALTELQSSAAEFVNNPNETNLDNLQSFYKEANIEYQKCSMYNIGPAMDYGIKGAFNTFPADTSKIETNIAAGAYTLGAVSNATAIGFPALDYLLFFGDDSEIVAKFSTNINAANRKTYLTDLITKMKNEFQPVLDQWNASYKTTFLNADGNDVASSCSYLLNEFVKDIELIKNAKIGIPSGQQTGGATLPNYVEAYYSGYSTSFAYSNLAGLRDCFNGLTGSGFDDYIRDVEGEDVTESLADKINSQFQICLNKIYNLNTPLSNTITSDFASVNEVYLELKKLVVYCKTDMTSMLGIMITYQDNDGD